MTMNAEQSIDYFRRAGYRLERIRSKKGRLIWSLRHFESARSTTTGSLYGVWWHFKGWVIDYFVTQEIASYLAHEFPTWEPDRQNICWNWIERIDGNENAHEEFSNHVYLVRRALGQKKLQLPRNWRQTVLNAPFGISSGRPGVPCVLKKMLVDIEKKRLSECVGETPFVRLKKRL